MERRDLNVLLLSGQELTLKLCYPEAYSLCKRIAYTRPLHLMVQLHSALLCCLKLQMWYLSSLYVVLLLLAMPTTTSVPKKWLIDIVTKLTWTWCCLVIEGM